VSENAYFGRGYDVSYSRASITRSPDTSPVGGSVASPAVDDLEATIKGHPFWQNLSPSYFPLLLAGARRVHYAPGELLTREGDTASRFWLIVSGQVELDSPIQGQTELQIQMIGPGHALGWSWLFPPYKSHFTARATVHTEAIAWETSHLRALAESNPAFGYDVASRMTNLLLQRLHAMHTHVVEFYSPET